MNDTFPIKKRYYEIIELIKRADYHYYNLNQPLMEDSTYDSLIIELIDIERKHPSLKLEESPTGKVGGVVSKTFSEVNHDPPMLSLGNIFTEEDLSNFDRRCLKNIDADDELLYCAELKFDGLAVEVIYEDGRFNTGATRGDGLVGEDVTANIATIGNMPLELSGHEIPDFLSVRGEVLMRHREFERLNRIREDNGESPFANPRNAASGSLRQIDSRISEGRQLEIVFYSIGKVVSNRSIVDQMQMYDYLTNLGLPVSEHIEYGNIGKIKKFYEYWLVNRYRLDFDIDGVVIKVIDFNIRDRLGATNKAPRWATAWKFPAKEAITVIESVDWQIGRTGLITPVANLRPINIGGVLVKRASLHNYNEVMRLDLRIGDSVRIKRAGDVIPKVIEAIREERPPDAGNINPPKRCPSCNTGLVKEDIFIRCINSQCIAKRLETLKFFVSKNGMDIESFGPELVIRLYNAEKLETIADIYRITKDDLLQLERMGDKLADKVISSIDSRRTIILSHFLRSLGIRNVGDHLSRVVARAVGGLNKLYVMEIDELILIDGIGPEVAESIYEFFHNESSLRIIKDILDAGVIVHDELVKESVLDEIRDRTFVFTGTLQGLTRKEAEEIVQKSGGRVTGTISKKTDYLVAGDLPGIKYEKAQGLGIKIIQEDEFVMMIGEKKWE
ncbi:MAG: NAD-dependent DNA ligase LigA [Spirochaetota bacterium]|nr:NAD-dependent DNA ligase LigA [Spirochaetota bacterium]